jgi:hypothetical protein
VSLCHRVSKAEQVFAVFHHVTYNGIKIALTSYMENENNDIRFTVIFRGKYLPVYTCSNEYDSLLSLISDLVSVSGFGVCYGGGSCGTCGVRISEQFADSKIVLSCETQISHELEQKIIRVR